MAVRPLSARKLAGLAAICVRRGSQPRIDPVMQSAFRAVMVENVSGEQLRVAFETPFQAGTHEVQSAQEALAGRHSRVWFRRTVVFCRPTMLAT